MKKFFLILTLLIIAAVLILPRLDTYQREGTLTLSALQAPVKVLRDDAGVPYIYADSLDDALTAQGFLHVQERTFQMELYKYLAHGRLAEFIGERGIKNDRIIRLLDLTGFAKEQLGRLSDEERNYLQRYLNGVNAFITDREDEYPLMFSVMGHTPMQWTLEDILAIQYFRIWSSSVNWRQELLTLQLIDKFGAERAYELRPLTINPDDPATEFDAEPSQLASLGLQFDDSLVSDYQPRYAMGSNAWASDGGKSANGAPILSNDPHLDARHLPGFWYPMGIVTPELRAVGTASPGGPGLGVGRTSHIAWGATNGYADMVDLYIETLDPDNGSNYIQGGQSLPFLTRTEELLIRDREAEGGFRVETMQIRETIRGPIISDHGMSLVEGKLLSMRWSVPEYVGPDSGNRELLLARSVDEALLAIGKTTVPLNYIVVDTAGNVARMGSGVVPIRSRGNGLVPLVPKEQDNWQGRIPPEEMPLQLNPAKGWVGSANHRVTKADYPYEYSTHFAGSWRYRRLMELFEKPVVSVDDHWAFNLDIKNLLAQRMLPAIIAAFEADPELQPLARELAAWDLLDDKDETAPLIFQTVLRHFAIETFSDDMDESLLMAYLNQTYYWQERVLRWYEQDGSPWFDDTRTEQIEDRDDIIIRAGRAVLTELNANWGEDSSSWRWGDAHTVTFFHPFIPGKDAAKWIGGGEHAMGGSGETLMRGLYIFDKPYEAKVIDSMRIIIDMADTEKVEAHFPGGVSERWFDPWNKNFLDSWLSGEKRYWWFSDEAINEHAQYELRLQP
ncbi:MAG: penicillin acylase family protein [Proteobacteria bacterium]|nr:penicillin acylase family protein [Pseudomonadota bacterium]